MKVLEKVFSMFVWRGRGEGWCLYPLKTTPPHQGAIVRERAMIILHPCAMAMIKTCTALSQLHITKHYTSTHSVAHRTHTMGKTLINQHVFHFNQGRAVQNKHVHRCHASLTSWLPCFRGLHCPHRHLWGRFHGFHFWLLHCFHCFHCFHSWLTICKLVNV